ncbi:hypothetical protein [Thermomonas sp.]|uniref:hypothetical protein n=1 Tax=Thermomonas sp. TaxID=1971895 RepID=UPI0024894E45|nr:hypothetical protein [Thermomonas sp.]MDI1253990.1 hypothetical protein [Thermomonas sp.]
MVDHVPSGTPSPDPRGDGVRIIKRGGTKHSGRLFKWVVVVLVGVCVVSGAVLLWPAPAARHESSDATANNAVANSGNDQPGAGMTARGDGMMPANSTRLAAADDISNYIAPGEAPPMAEVIARLNKAGVHTGLGAFSPPGTSPPMVGLAVPEDFKLPEGYVRHYQATDDGQRIDPILMFSPDFEFLDAAGRPLPLPANMVVPPNMAPPGLPIHLIKIPPPLAAQGSPG